MVVTLHLLSVKILWLYRMPPAERFTYRQQVINLAVVHLFTRFNTGSVGLCILSQQEPIPSIIHAGGLDSDVNQFDLIGV
ncbi:MAG TPA: hypothetical protein PLX18_11135 [Anaerohalosphaeraceae bacterium]|nr:hypothetical protein [Anaerohalosphaeraceae bacterium]